MHCTKFGDETSSCATINSSIIQGSGIGPSCFVLNTSDLQPSIGGNVFDKYADDTYLIVPPTNTLKVGEEVSQIQEWAGRQNLTLNTQKTKEMLLFRPRSKPSFVPPVIVGIQRVESIKILGILLDSKMTFGEHAQKVVSRCAQSLYAIRTLKAHGLSGKNLWQVTESTLISGVTYASQAWWGMLDSSHLQRLESMINKIIKQGYLQAEHPTFTQICKDADDKLFQAVLSHKHHVLHHLLPLIKETGHVLRTRAHNREIPAVKLSTLRKTFLYRMLYLNSY